MAVNGVAEHHDIVAVIGAGTMGAGIAQVAAAAGLRASLRDVGARELDRARDSIGTSLARFVKSGRMTDEQADATVARIRFTESLEEAVFDAAIVIEVVPEILALKHEVFTNVVNHARPDALLATNTSQFSITAIGAVIEEAAPRLIGMHFFNPPVMMKLVELIRGETTTDETLDRALAFADTLGKEAVVCRKDSPGFITTRAYAALRLECLRMLDEGVATAEDIDKALRLGFNFPMGPLELGDFNGLDISLRALSALQEAYGDRFRPTVGLRNMVAAGKLGRKTGEGFYRYGDDGQRLPVDD